MEQRLARVSYECLVSLTLGMTTRRSSSGGNGIAKRMGEQGRLGVPFGDDWEELHAGMLVPVRPGTAGTAGWSPMAIRGSGVV